MDRRTVLIAVSFLPLGSEARTRKRKRKQRKPRTLTIADHTSDWAAAIEEGIAIVNPLLADWHPQLVYLRGQILPLPAEGEDGVVGVYEVPALVNERGMAEAYYDAWRKAPGHRGRISLKASYPTQSWVIVHELMHVLAAVYEHTGWEDRDPPFDPSLILREDIGV